ncbi:MAG: spore germination protein [Oscillospiraceae bacterium]|nr:spore germination protein [Oscillospiraceae bacterium]MDD3833083.1 spore germination protein [Oscillospiraceae bacterium]MDD4546307.1 spore germination protein [Oscillospiraceae bacterium]
MFKYINKKLRYGFFRLTEQNNHPPKPEDDSKKTQETLISGNLTADLEYIRKLLGTSSDIKMHEFRYGEDFQLKGALVFVDGLVSNEILTESIMKPLIMNRNLSPFQTSSMQKTLDTVRQTILCSGDITEKYTIGELVESCLSGDTVFLSEGFDKALIISSKGWEKRSITEPQTESVVRGPREGFTENFRTNTALIRRRIKSANLRLDHMSIGEKTDTNVCVAYIDGVADPNIVDTVKARLKSINTDAIMDSGYIEQYIEDHPFSLFPTVGYSEKPDVITARMLEGRVAIISDGSPFVTTAPMLLLESFQTSEDYYIRPYFASLLRIFRYLAFIITVSAPAFFIALTTYHQELIPTTLLLTIISAREGTPFPATLEAIILILSFEILREAGVRLPRPLGQAISIVGALVMGEAAVTAGLVGAPMVITIAITAVAEFAVPDQSEAASILRIIFLVLASVLGAYGIALGFLGVLIHLASLKSFGVPYCTNLTFNHNMQDSYIRMPLWFMSKRPKAIVGQDKTRNKTNTPPSPLSKNSSPEENP